MSSTEAMIYIKKDPTLRTLLVQEALKARGLYTGEADNWAGPRTDDAYQAFLLALAPQLPIPVAENKYRDISAEGRQLVKEFEGLYLEAYQDEVGIWTIGWGHTGLSHNDGTVFRGRKITLEKAEELFTRDMDFFEGRVERLISVPLNGDEFSALVSFDFNTGGLEDSTLRRLLNAGDRRGAAEQFARWNKAGGAVLAGLTRRRMSERNLFLGKRPFLVG
jgi:lysozyme